jgi:hypothetical protein
MDLLAREVMRGPESWISYNWGDHESTWVMDILTREVMRGPESCIS